MEVLAEGKDPASTKVIDLVQAGEVVTIGADERKVGDTVESISRP